MKQDHQLPISKDPKLAQQQQQHASDAWDSCSRAAARLYRTPEAWGRPDDTVSDHMLVLARIFTVVTTSASAHMLHRVSLTMLLLLSP